MPMLTSVGAVHRTSQQRLCQKILLRAISTTFWDRIFSTTFSKHSLYVRKQKST